MKVLVIGQIPKELGGSYTTGVCNVVYELSKCKEEDINQIIFATNAKDKICKNILGFSKYRGYKYRLFCILLKVIFNPMQTIKEWAFYRNKNHMSIVRCEFYRDNFARIIKEVKPDIIHCQNVVQMGPLYFANRGTNIPIVITLHGVFYNGDEKIKELIHENTLKADFVTGLTPETMKGIKNIGFPMQKAFLISNGVNTSMFYYDDKQRNRIRQELGVDEDCTLLITVGSLQHRKGQLEFLKILKVVPKSFKYKYLIIGSGSDRFLIDKFCERNDMVDRVTVYGYMDNRKLFGYYSAADVYIHSSFAEGQALSEIEAYATDLKIAVNRKIKDTIVTDTSIKEDYYLFDYNNFNISDFIIWAIMHKKNRNTRCTYAWSEIYKQYVNMYKEILLGK